MYLGRQQLGTWLDVYLQCRDAALLPLMPDAVPRIKIRRASDNAVVHSDLMPIVDKGEANVGLFCTRLLLGSGFAVGQHSVEMVYVLSGAARIESRTFEIMAAGNPAGQTLAMVYFHTPQAEYIVYSVESGVILKGKSPRIN